MTVELHIAYHVAEALTIVYLLASHHQTKQMLIHLARTVTSVNDHLDSLIMLSSFEIKHEKECITKDFPNEETEVDK